jgi:predicted MPP superfamily phosphohydrolase
MNRRRFLRWTLGSALAGTAGGAVYGRAEAGSLRVVPQTIALPQLPPPFAGCRVALLTDLHHSPFNGIEFIRHAVATTNGLNPDLVALGGDFIQWGDFRYAGPYFRALRELRARWGVYAVAGNHDHVHDGAQAVRRAMHENGIIDVNNAGRRLKARGHRLRVAGVDDFQHGRQDLPAALGDATQEDPCILLSHNPDHAEKLTDRRVGLVLSGHMHGGQIVIPGLGYHCIPSRYGLKYLEGLVQAPCAQVFVSRGLGTVILPVRFRCPPEINLITLVPA